MTNDKLKDARVVAALAVNDVLKGRSLSASLPKRNQYLSAADRALASELAYGACRWYPRLKFYLSQLLKQPLRARDSDVEAVLLTGLYQLSASRIPAHAAVSTTVQAARLIGKAWAAKLVNAILRRFQREQKTLLEVALKQPEAQYCLPAWLIGKIKKAWGEQLQQVADVALAYPPMTLRVNIQANSITDYNQLLRAQEMTATTVNSVPCALVLEKAVAVQQLPGFAQADVSVQDAGAQLAAGLLDLQAGQQVLDACSAPGGKALHLLQTCETIELTAMDVSAERLQRVAENLERAKLKARLLAGDAVDANAEWADRQYDRILLDAPCSATGVIRRHPDIKLLRRPEDVKSLVLLQKEILQTMWSALKSGGKLLYVTCSVLPEENDSQIQHFVANQDDARVGTLSGDWGIKCLMGRQILPGEQNMDGFYYALLEKQ